MFSELETRVIEKLQKVYAQGDITLVSLAHHTGLSIGSLYRLLHASTPNTYISRLEKLEKVLDGCK